MEDPTPTITYDDAYAELYQAQWDRQAIRDQLNASSVPDGLTHAHTELVGVVDDPIAALQSAYDGAADSDKCLSSCYYETPRDGSGSAPSRPASPTPTAPQTSTGTRQ
jgi:hypothetical protein